MNKIELKAETRSIIGRKVKAVRRAGFVPAVIYGRGLEPLIIQVPIKDFEKVYTEAGESTLVYLDVSGQSYPTIIHDIVKDPINDKIQHADFYKVNLDEKIHAKISLSFIGESLAVKGLGGILVKNISELEVEGLPQDLPHNIEVDISSLNQFNDHILVKDLPISNKIIIKAKLEDIVALIQEPISEEELKAQLETPVVTAPEDVEVIKKEKLEEEPAEEIPTKEATPEQK